MPPHSPRPPSSLAWGPLPRIRGLLLLLPGRVAPPTCPVPRPPSPSPGASRKAHALGKQQGLQYPAPGAAASARGAAAAAACPFAARKAVYQALPTGAAAVRGPLRAGEPERGGLIAAQGRPRGKRVAQEASQNHPGLVHPPHMPHALPPPLPLPAPPPLPGPCPSAAQAQQQRQRHKQHQQHQ